MSLVSVDSLENEDFAVCEDENGDVFYLDTNILPKSLKEGDMIFTDEKGNWHLDEEATEKRKEKIKKLRRKVYNQE